MGFAHEQVIQTNGVELWCETFGNRNQPALLLMMGGGCQGIMWPEAFCYQLTQAGFFVIRYDHRDMGLSTPIDFEQNPYDLVDLAKDAIGILDDFGIDQAHVMGASMGGAIAQLMAVYYPQRIQSLVLMSTSCDFGILIDALEGKPTNSPLSRPSDGYLTLMRTIISNPAKTNEQRINQSLHIWRLLNGSVVEFDEELYRDLLSQQLKRLKHRGGLQHQILAIKASLEAIKRASPLIEIPTLVIHGTEDPIFPPDHGHALSASIKNARLLLIEGMGHNLNTRFYPCIIESMKQRIKDSK
jgi:pimeloyl-ACP methyl ester carboxylesterase